jgi:tetratricopeptide (TPR) repeat protein
MTLTEIRVSINSGTFPVAESALKQFLQTTPESSEANTLLDIVLAQSARPQEAQSFLQDALELDPANPEALTWLASLKHQEGRLEDAVNLLTRALEIKRDDPEIYNLLGVCLLALGRGSEAEITFRTLIRMKPDSGASYANRGMALRLLNRGDEALKAFKRAVLLDPNHPQNYLQVFKQYQLLARSEEAAEALEEGVAKHPHSALLAEALAVAYGSLGRSSEAEEIFRRLAPLSATGANSYATWLQDEGRFAESIPVLHHSLKLKPKQGYALRCLAEAHQFQAGDVSLIDLAEALLGQDRESGLLPETERMHALYALGKSHEEAGNYPAAIRAYDEANLIAYRSYPRCRTFNRAWTMREPQLIAELFRRETFEQIEPSPAQDSRPIFIVGMIRSGTTLLDQIVSAHPSVTSRGEGSFWTTKGDDLHAQWQRNLPSTEALARLASEYLTSMQIARADGRFTDKMPLNFRSLGLIHATLPKAKILHIRRDPFDTCMSIYTTFFAGGPNFVYHQENIATFYRAYLQTMEHWRTVLPTDQFFELTYEDLVLEPEIWTRKVLEFLGLEWDEACLRPDQNRDRVTTPSRWQARQPIYTSSLNKREIFASLAPQLAEL